MKNCFVKKSRVAEVCGYFAVAAVMTGLPADRALAVFVLLEQLVEEYSAAYAKDMYAFFKGENPELEAYMKDAIQNVKLMQEF